ncbi:integrase catalytic domain-containing protein [Klebsiella pneumoniae]
MTAPLEQVQIDHTVIDLIVVDDRDRQTYWPPVPDPRHRRSSPAACSAWSSRWKRRLPFRLACALVHVACDKRPWLEGLNVEMDWQMSGKPLLLYPDNAAEFKSEALRRGCEQHGIRLDYRPLGQPHYGGIVERIIGTAALLQS